MSDEKFRMDCRAKKCTVYEGGNAGLEIKDGDCEVRRDVMVKRTECVRVWGQVKDCRGCPVEDALVKLVKQVYKGRKYWYVGIAHTLTDCQGFYQFDICRKDEKCTYRVIAGKAAMDRYYDAPAASDEEPRPGYIPQEEMADEADEADETDEAIDEETSGDEGGSDTEEPGDPTDEEESPPDVEELDEEMAQEEDAQAPDTDGAGPDDDEEYPYKSSGKKNDKFDPDEDFLGDAYDRYGCDPCRYFMKD